MRLAFAFLVFTAIISSSSYAGDKEIKFNMVQEQCVQTGKIKFGANARWSNCSVTKGRWFATLDFIDMYQAQYCLRKVHGACDTRALVVFANRAYKPDARMMLQRIDSGNVEYDDPLVVQTKYGDILTLSARSPDGSVSKSYYRWHSGSWTPVAARLVARAVREVTQG